jgi:hypothetical protein
MIYRFHIRPFSHLLKKADWKYNDLSRQVWILFTHLAMDTVVMLKKRRHSRQEEFSDSD